MELSGLSSAAMNPVIMQGLDNVPCEEETASFQRFIAEVQIKSDIVSHLKGVPLNTVTISPNIIEKMATDQAAYTYYMNAIDEYARGYQQYNCPGAVQMSFFITEDGKYCIRGENLILQSQIEASKKEDTYQTRKDERLQEFFLPQQLSQTSQTDCPMSDLAAAYLMEHLRIFKKGVSNQ